MWPQEKNCKMCNDKFLAYRPQHLYCTDNGCKQKRTRQRWKAWQEREIAKGTYYDNKNTQQIRYREQTRYQRRWELKSKYGLTLDQWFDMLDAANNVCEICGFAAETLCVDHDHATGKVRGVLCRKCNRAIGQFDDDPDLLRKAIDYLSSRME
jgi:hypothetical protein